MNKRDKNRIEGLTASKAARGKTVKDDEVFDVLQQIDTARKGGQTSLRIPATGARLEKELKDRGFTVENTGMVLHISWSK